MMDTTHQDLPLRHVSEADTRRAMDIGMAAEVIRETYRGMAGGAVRLSAPSAMAVSGPPHRLGVKGAVLEPQDVAGVRLTSRAASRIFLWRLSSGEPLALVDESWLYRFRTGVSAAVVAGLLLGGRRPEKVALVGTGPIGWEMACALDLLIGPAVLAVAARRPESAEDFARRAGAAGVAVEPATSPAEAARDADVVVTITASDRAFLADADLRPDALVLSMGGTPEFAFDVWQTAGVRLVDEIGYALGRGDIGAWIAAGEIDAAGVEAGLTGTVAALAAGEVTLPAPPAGRVLAIVQGVAALDIALAAAVVDTLETERRA